MLLARMSVNHPRIGTMLLIIVVLSGLIVLAGCGQYDNSDVPKGTPVEGFPQLTSHLVEVDGLVWHYVEGGQGEPIVFLHGLPESWFSWHYQLTNLMTDYRVIAIDLKGYGQSDKADGDYTAANVAEEVVALMDLIGLGKFNLVSHDWGTAVSDNIAGNHPDRIVRFVRMECPVHRLDPANHPQFALLQNQQLATAMMMNSDDFVRGIYTRMTVQTVLEEDLSRIVEEFSRPGVAQAVPRYFRDMGGSRQTFEERLAIFGAMDFPVLLLQADSDPNQPAWYFEGATDLFPNAELQWVENSGHFSELEQPEAVTEAIRDFLAR